MVARLDPRPSVPDPPDGSTREARDPVRAPEAAAPEPSAGSGRRPSRPTWAVIDREALRRNLGRARSAAGGRRVIAVVKADAYGHGAACVGRTLADAGADALAVATLEEALELRAQGIGVPILLLEGLHRPGDAPAVVSADLAAAVVREDTLPALDAAGRAAGRRIPVHLKVDTGMGRLGLLPSRLGPALDVLRGARGLELAGLMTHLAESDDAHSGITARQRAVFGEVLAHVRSAGFAPAWIHADPSAGLLRGPTPQATAVRPGVMLYGVDPTLERSIAGLDPVMTLRTRVLQARDVPAHTRVGYGGTYTTPGPTRLLTLPIGYADGLPRACGGRIRVWVEGALLPLVGRVSMDLASVDAGPGSRVDVGGEVVVFGRAGDRRLPVEDVAQAVDTIAYEILTGIGPRVPRLPAGSAAAPPPGDAG